MSDPQKKHYYGSTGTNNFIVETPDWLKEEIVEEFGDYFYPCPINPQFDGLSIDWPNDRFVYVNPPYTRGSIAKWVEKCSIEHQKGCSIGLLIPSYTDTKYFHDYIYLKDKVVIRFFRGRIKFKGYENKAGEFPSMFVIFENKITSKKEGLN